MQELYQKMKPGGSGPLGLMRIIRALIEAIAADKGYKVQDSEVER